MLSSRIVYRRFMLAMLSACQPTRPSVSIDRSSWAIGLSRPPRGILRAQLLLGHLLALRLAAAVEHLRELLPLARRADVDTHLHGERDRRTERVELRVGVAEPRVHLVLEPLCACRAVEAAHVHERRIDEGLLSPAVQLARPVQQQVRGAERVGDGEAQRGALRQSHLERVERDVQVRVRGPRPSARVPLGEPAELREQALARRARAVVDQRLHCRGERGIGRRRPDRRRRRGRWSSRRR